MTAPSRPRTWSPLASFGAVVRAVLVVALVAMVAWPEWHHYVGERSRRYRPGWPQFDRHLRGVYRRVPLRKTKHRRSRLSRVALVPVGGYRVRLLARESSLGTILPRGD